MKNSNFYIVGIGASAGGYEALKTFFSGIPEKPGIAFVLIQHLSRDFKSLTKDWLSKQTKMEVSTVSEDTEVQPDHIYVMPEDKTLKMKGRKLVLAEREPNVVINLAIDTFFHSLGQELKEKAIGVILSGTGTDGSRGIRTIKEQGGVVLVQQPDSAEFDGMPNVAITTDHPDMILPPEELAEGLLKYVQNPASIDEDAIIHTTTTDKEMIEEIIDHVSEYSKVNFRGYKINTIIRRIEKRIKLNHLTNIAAYHSFTRHNAEEIQALYQSLLIGVTHFFRDPEAFKALKEKVIPELFKNRKSFETVRIWVVGCSTGEEAYSIGILCDEYTQQHSLDIPFKIFATDLDHRSIEVAAIGRYRNDIVADVNPERLHHYFNKAGDFYEVKKELRRKIIFARHNLMSDPPFIKLDLITCRNLFIYLKPDLQNKLLHNFNFALEPNAFLFLGANESSNSVDELFEHVDTQWKIVRNKPEVERRPYVFGQHNSELVSFKSSPLRLKDQRNRARLSKQEEDYEEILINQYAPSCVFVNEENEVVYTHGPVEKHLRLPKKRMVLNIFDMISGNLAMIFRSGMRKVRGGEPSVVFKEVLFQEGEHQLAVNISFNAIENKDKGDKLVLITFIETPFVAVKEVVMDDTPKDTSSYKVVEELEEELRLTKKELQFTVDELETLNEELQASNEEMHSSNEELQSTNEEMQSTNEELHTVNVELQMKLDEVISLHNDIHNLVNNAEIAIVFLDQDLNIRMFTPAAKGNFNFLESDIGRPFDHLTHNFLYHQFLEDIREVLHHHKPVEKEVEDRNGKFYIIRILPYKTDDKHVKGVVLTFLDVTQLRTVTNDLKKRTDELEISGQNWKSLVNNTPDLIARYDEAIRYISVNEAMEKHLGLPFSEIIGKSNRELAVPNDQEEVKRWVNCVEETFKTGKTSNTFFAYDGPSTKHYYSSFVPEHSRDGSTVQSVLTISRDVTQIKEHEKLIESQNAQLKKVNTDLDNFVYTASHDLKSPISNIEGLIRVLNDRMAGRINEPEKRVIEMIERSILKFKSTIMDLTEITKVHKNIEHIVESLLFKDVLEEVKADIQEMIRESEATIREELEVKSIIYSKHNLRSILYNLLSNAIKYRSPERPVEILVSTYQEGEAVVLWVVDNGLGLTPDQKDKIFEMFKRLHTHVDGTGIGLYIVKRTIENNGGTIEVESEKDKGTTFKISFYPDDHD